MGVKLLIIDDVKEDRELMIRFLKEADYDEISEAESGEEGLESIQKNKPDIIILDTLMPGIDGFETCKRIKALEGQTAKVIICTSSVDAIDASKAREVGADDYCVKTSDNDVILSSVKKMSGA